MDKTTPQPNKAPQGSNGETLKAKELEGALKGVVKLFGAIRFYPAGHPALKDSTREALKGFAPLLQGVESLACAVRRDHFALGEAKFGGDNPQMSKFAGHLFMRRVQRLLFLPDLTARDLWHFVQVLMVDAAETQKRGGFQELLSQERISTIWANELNLSAVLTRKASLDEEKRSTLSADAATEDEDFFAAETVAPAEDPPTSEVAESQPENAGQSPEQRLRELLEALQQTRNDAQRQGLIQQVPPLLMVNVSDAGRPLVVQALLLLGRLSREKLLTPECSESAAKALGQAGTDQVLSTLVLQLCAKDLPDDQREQIYELGPVLGDRFTALLLTRLCEDGEAMNRKLLSEALVRQGPCAVPRLIEALQDRRWYVVRNAVVILGEIREPEALPGIEKTLSHNDHRVRREAIRAITRIGGGGSIRLLLQLVEGDFPDLRRQAMLSLGAMKNPAAVQPLLRIIQSDDKRHRLPELKKEAIRTLGEIGSYDAVPSLAELVLQRRFWFRSRHDELRAAAVAAIGVIGDPAAEEVLEWAAADRSQTVARAAQQALKQVRRAAKR